MGPPLDGASTTTGGSLASFVEVWSSLVSVRESDSTIDGPLLCVLIRPSESLTFASTLPSSYIIRGLGS